MSTGFAKVEYRLADLRLKPLTPDERRTLAFRMSADDPWARLGMKAETLERALRDHWGAVGHGPRAFGVFSPRVSGEPIGCVTLKPNWLAGPYLSLLYVDQTSRWSGTGRRILDWFEAEAQTGGAANLWVCVSEFNGAALAFYRRFGFEKTAILADLVMAGSEEVLLRKRL